MTSERHPSFSPARKWSLSLNTALSLMAVLALVVMANYLAARHFKRWPVSSQNPNELSPLTQRILAGITNEIRITVYFSQREPLFEMTRDLLKNYRLANDRLTVDLVDYERDPGAAQVIKARYQLSDNTDRDMVIFDCKGGGRKFVYQSELSELDLQPLVSGQSREVRRTAFKGELLFTSAIHSVISPRRLKAYFLQGHNEHDPQSTDRGGYGEFARVLDENNIQHEPLLIEGSAPIPPDCSLLIIAGPVGPISTEVLEKIDRYLAEGQGGRLLMLFRFESLLYKPTGLESLMGKWGVAVGRNVVLDEQLTEKGNDVVLANFSGHPLIKAFIKKAQIQLFLPRSIGRLSSVATGADTPQVDVLAETSPAGRVVKDIRADGVIKKSPGDYVGSVPVMVAVEKGGIRNVSADRGTSRLVVIGDSSVFSNGAIDRGANHQFASHCVNWLLAQNELIAELAPRPIKDFKVTMTVSQMSAAQWLLLAAFPGTVLALGGLVWLRRRR